MVVLPLVAALISLACAAIAFRRYGMRRRPHELAWGIAFGLFALAAFAEVVGDIAGWTPLLVRVYYVSGVVLTTAFLGLGSLYLLLGRRLARWGPGIMLVLTALGVAFVFNTPVDTTRLDQGWHALQRAGTPTYLLTTLSNAVGATIVVGGALYSIFAGRWRGMPRERTSGLILIALGTLVVASGGVVARRFGNDDYLYTTMAPGVAIILLGYLQANRAPAKGLPAAPAEAAGAAPFAATSPAPIADVPPRRGAGATAEVTVPPPNLASPRPAPAPPPGLTIRPLTPADAAGVRAILRCSGAAATSPLASEIRYGADEAVAALLARPDASWLGADLDGRLVALARLIPGATPATRHTAHLAPFAVGAGETGRGIGTALLAEVLRWADGHLGLARLDLWADPGDERAARFYERHGFAREGVLKNALFAEGRHRAVLVLARTRDASS